MRVYHGSTVVVETPLVGVGRKNLDFGQGFYVTDLEQQAISWAQRPLNAEKLHVINEYELDIDKIKEAHFTYRHFAAYDAEWLEFVVASRRGEKVWQGYDIIEGGIANDRVFNTIELYMAGLTPREETLQKLMYEKPNNQICILNQTIADDYMRFINARTV